MQDVEFFGQLERLEKTFGKNHFSSERADMIYVAVRDMDYEWFKRLCNKMISSLRQAPMPNDFIEAAQRERGRIFDQQTQQAADKWASGEFNGLKKYLESIGAVSLTDAMDMARQNIKNGGNGLPEGEENVR